MPYFLEIVVIYLSTNSTSSFNRAHLERRDCVYTSGICEGCVWRGEGCVWRGEGCVWRGVCGGERGGRHAYFAFGQKTLTRLLGCRCFLCSE